jgi:hypothetical protein
VQLTHTEHTTYASNDSTMFAYSELYKRDLEREISGSHGSEYEGDCLLGCCAV